MPGCCCSRWLSDTMRFLTTDSTACDRWPHQYMYLLVSYTYLVASNQSVCECSKSYHSHMKINQVPTPSVFKIFWVFEGQHRCCKKHFSFKFHFYNYHPHGSSCNEPLLGFPGQLLSCANLRPALACTAMAAAFTCRAIEH